MITKENFCKIINKIQEYEEFIDKVGEYVNLERVDELFIEGEIQDIFFKELFNEKQVDVINAYLYEPECLEDIVTPEELYDYLMTNQFTSSE